MMPIEVRLAMLAEVMNLHPLEATVLPALISVWKSRVLSLISTSLSVSALITKSCRDTLKASVLMSN